MRAAFLVLTFTPLLAKAGEWAKARQCTGPDGKGGLSCLAWSEYPAPGETATWCGAIANGKCDGEGVLEWRKAGELTKRYIGPLRVGKKEGHGALEWRDGRRYRGGFHADRMHGRGLFRGKDGTLYDGFWLGGRRVSDRVFQRYLARGRAAADVRDLRVSGIRLQDFYSRYKPRLANARVTTPEGAPYRELTAPGLVVRVAAPWDAAAREEWVILSIRVTGGEARTGRGAGLKSSWEEIQAAYPGWPAICLDPSLVAVGPPPCLRFESDTPWGAVTEIVLDVLPEDHDDSGAEE